MKIIDSFKRQGNCQFAKAQFTTGNLEFETFFFSDELIVLSASGTAACVDLHLATSGPLQGILCM